MTEPVAAFQVFFGNCRVFVKSEWLKDLVCQRIAFGETDKRMKMDSCVLASLRAGMSLPKLMMGEVIIQG